MIGALIDLQLYGMMFVNYAQMLSASIEDDGSDCGQEAGVGGVC